MLPLYNLSWNKPNQAAQNWLSGKGRIGSNNPDVSDSNIPAPSAWQNGITKGVGLANGITQSYMIGNNISRVRETPGFDASVGNLNALSSYGFNTYDQIKSAQDAFIAPDMPTWNDIRGASGAQRGAAIAGGTINGFTTGFQLGGIYGGIAGAFLGGGAAVNDVLAGNRTADSLYAYNGMRVNKARDVFNMNKASSMENIANDNNRFGTIHSVARGGQIQTRKQEDIKHFAERILGEKNVQPRVVRKKCKGGVMIKINR